MYTTSVRTCGCLLSVVFSCAAVCEIQCSRLFVLFFFFACVAVCEHHQSITGAFELLSVQYPHSVGRLYSTTIVTMTGLAGRTGAMWVVTGMMSVGLCGLVVGVALVERVGRRPLLLSSLLGIAVSLLFVAITFHVIHDHSPGVQLPAVDPECETHT